MSEQNSMPDRFDIALTQSSQSLLECQSKKGLASCMKCDEFFSCKIRQEYVDSAYKSMSKSDSDDGGFDF
ncbi:MULTISPECIES: hypothetical protein [unclassified Campylobacter]|uniref:hypothetical protein n=1 Tax=unclassified Campylobacter TaxID=2593542 RepID=UPI003D339DA1